MSKKGIVTIHGREYKTVVLRVNEFHKSRTQTQRITTELVYHDEKRVIVKATVWDGDVAIGTGYGEEWRDTSNINKTSAMENAETSSIGRALACIGLGGTEYASADEVLRAIAQQDEMEEAPPPATDPLPSEPTTENPDQDQWTSDIPDDILDVVGENYKLIQKREEDGVGWHIKTVRNFLQERPGGQEHIIDVIKRLSREQLAELADIQNEKLKLLKED